MDLLQSERRYTEAQLDQWSPGYNPNDHVVHSTHTYPASFLQSVKTVQQQIDLLVPRFPRLSWFDASKLELDPLSGPQELLLAVPRIECVGTSYTSAIRNALIMLVGTPGFAFTVEAGLVELLQPSTAFERAETGIGRDRSVAIGDFHVMPIQAGIHHRGRSPHGVWELTRDGKQFSLGVFETCMLLLTHPERMSDAGALGIDCSGTTVSEPECGIEQVLSFSFGDRCGGRTRVSLTKRCRSVADAGFGTPTAFLPTQATK